MYARRLQQTQCSQHGGKALPRLVNSGIGRPETDHTLKAMVARLGARFPALLSNRNAHVRPARWWVARARCWRPEWPPRSSEHDLQYRPLAAAVTEGREQCMGCVGRSVN